MKKFQKYFSLLFFLAFSFGASAWGGFVTSIYKEPWYSTLIKPSFNPPDYIFPTVWVILYISMALAIWLIWINPKKELTIVRMSSASDPINIETEELMFSVFNEIANII